VVLDESHEWLSVRKGTGDKEADKDEKELRKELVTWSSHHRKFGWHVYLVTQDEMRIDSHVRGNAEFKCKLKNLKNVPILGLKPFPNLFVVHTYWHGASRKNERVKMEMYTLNKKRAGLYDTMASPVLNLGIDADGVIPLPLTRLQRAARGTAPEIRPTVVEKLKEKRKIAA
jgi:zona occludens toxin (predicted ATPase)